VRDRATKVHRDGVWDGVHYEGDELVFLACVDSGARVAPSRLVGHETTTFQGYCWCGRDEIDSLADPVEPAEIDRIVCALAPWAPWTPSHP